MPELLRMPEIAANMESAVLSTWLVAEGASYAAKEVIAVIETDKAIVDFEAEAAGTLVRRLVEDGVDVEVGAPIALVAAAGESVGDVDAALAALGIDASADAGHSPNDDAPAGLRTGSDAPAPAPVMSDGPVERRFSSPLARKMAREAGVDLAALTGTGPNGRIVRRDVVAAIAAGSLAVSTGAGPAATASPQVAPPADSAAVGVAVDVPHSRLRRAIASRLIESKTTAPHFYVRGTANVERLLRLREQINDGAEVRVSVNDLLIKAMAKAHLQVPALNVIWTTDAIRQFSTVDISVAIATETGLVTPVIRSVERLTVTEVATTVRDFAERARAGRIQQHELEGGTTSISNLGMYGTEEFAAIINPPQASILAVGAARSEPVVRDGQVVAGTVMTVTLSVDHRPVDGVRAAEWMRAFIALVEKPAQILS